MECPVCMEIYHNPLLLPGCGHTLCQNCAEILITEGNFLRCPECRLVYQLRQGIKSLPKNVALQRTIDEHRNASRVNLMCDEHPDDAVSLYCKTCEKSICLKCFFTNNTLRRGQSLHVGHQVDTSEDALSKEKRLLEEKCRDCRNQRTAESKYISDLEAAELKLKGLLEDKLAEVDKNKTDLITRIKQTTGKLKFTLKGSAARDAEFLQMALGSARERLTVLEAGISDADTIICKTGSEQPSIHPLKEARRKLSELPEINTDDRPSVESFLKVQFFDTDVDSCLRDPKKALSYQTEPPRAPTVDEEECIISDTKACIVVSYVEAVRAKKLTLYYKEAMYKGMSEKQFESVEITALSQGVATATLKDLERGTMYRIYATASNDFGESAQSPEVYFRTVDADIEIRKT